MNEKIYNRPPEPKLSRSWKNKTFILDKIAIKVKEKEKRPGKVTVHYHYVVTYSRKHEKAMLNQPDYVLKINPSLTPF